MTKRLTPMLDDPRESAHVRELLEAGRSARVTDYDFEQGLRRHLSQVEAGAALPQWAQTLQAGAPAAGGALGGSLWLWIGLPLISVTAISAILLITSPNDAKVAPVSVPAAPAQPSAAVAEAPAPGAVAAVPAPEGAARRRAEATQPNRTPRRARPPVTAAPSPIAPSVVAEEPVQVARRSATKPSPTPAPGLPLKAAEPSARAERIAAPAAKVEAVRQPEDRPEEQPAEEEAAQAPARPEPEPKPVVDEARLEREMGMLAMTQRVLFTDPARALNLARQGEAEFEGSMFTQERQQLLLLALVKLGRLDEAKRLARPYLARYPHGPFSDRVRRSLATGRVDR